MLQYSTHTLRCLSIYLMSPHEWQEELLLPIGAARIGPLVAVSTIYLQTGWRLVAACCRRSTMMVVVVVGGTGMVTLMLMLRQLGCLALHLVAVIRVELELLALRYVVVVDENGHGQHQSTPQSHCRSKNSCCYHLPFSLQMNKFTCNFKAIVKKNKRIYSPRSCFYISEIQMDVSQQVTRAKELRLPLCSFRMH